MFFTIPPQKWTSFAWTCFLTTENLSTGECNQALTRSVFPFSPLKLWSTHNQPWFHENPLRCSLAWDTYLIGLLSVVNLHVSGMIVVQTGPILETLEDKFWKNTVLSALANKLYIGFINKACNMACFSPVRFIVWLAFRALALRRSRLER